MSFPVSKHNAISSQHTCYLSGTCKCHVLLTALNKIASWRDVKSIFLSLGKESQMVEALRLVWHETLDGHCHFCHRPCMWCLHLWKENGSLSKWYWKTVKGIAPLRTLTTKHIHGFSLMSANGHGAQQNIYSDLKLRSHRSLWPNSLRCLWNM